MPNVLRAAIVVFVASFCTLVIEIVAGRIMAPHVGVSLYTWTSIIGVVLAGISAGAWAGGWLADKRPSASTLGWLLLLSGAAALLITPLTDILAADEGLLDITGIAQTLLSRVVVLAFLLFFIPSFLLGMISPVAVKLALRDLESTGRTVGRLYAISTVGSIAGTFATGFYFIAQFGTRATLVGVASGLIVTALVFGGLLGKRSSVAVALLAVIIAGWQLIQPRSLRAPIQNLIETPMETGMIFHDESQYYTIQVERTVRDDNGAPLYALHLDNLIHSYSDPADPSHLAYGYLRLFREVLRWKSRQASDPHILFLGGGGYTLPRLYAETWPQTSIDVVEIDPAVTRAARKFLHAPPPDRVRTFNEDARWHVMRSKEKYDIVYVDVFNDLSVPYHLTTREMTEQLYRLLEFDGVLVANVIDNYERGRFLPSYIRTLQAVFGNDNVRLLVDDRDDAGDVSSTYVVVASTGVERMVDYLYGDLRSQHAWGYAVPLDELRKYLAKGRGIVLTDDFAPVDNMLAARFSERFVDR